MDFVNGQLAELMGAPNTDPRARAERANLCLEERVPGVRQATYEADVGEPPDWPAWRQSHYRYVQEHVRRRHPLSAAFEDGDALRPHLEANQELYRVERINEVVSDYADQVGVAIDVARISQWIATQEFPRTSASVAENDIPSAEYAALAALTEQLNLRFADSRPRFVTFTGEFAGLERQCDWPTIICERGGLAHHFTGAPVTLALFRYSVQEVLSACRETYPDSTVFAVPTALDHPMSSVYFSAPRSLHAGHTIGLAPTPDCTHLAAELIHARMDYRPEHWVAVSTINRNPLSAADVERLRASHLECLRRTSGNADYGSRCID